MHLENLENVAMLITIIIIVGNSLGEREILYFLHSFLYALMNVRFLCVSHINGAFVLCYVMYDHLDTTISCPFLPTFIAFPFMT